MPIVAPTASAGEIRQALLGQQYESATHIVVCAQTTFLGILRIEDLLAAPETALANALMDADPPYVAPGVDQEVAAWRAVQHAESALAVVDAGGGFVGLIPPHRLLAVLLLEPQAGLEGDYVLVHGIPFQVISDTATAQHVDLIIMGTHGRTGLTRVLMGSVAERVVRLGPCPVLVTRAPAKTPALEAGQQGAG